MIGIFPNHDLAGPHLFAVLIVLADEQCLVADPGMAGHVHCGGIHGDGGGERVNPDLLRPHFVSGKVVPPQEPTEGETADLNVYAVDLKRAGHVNASRMKGHGSRMFGPDIPSRIELERVQEIPGVEYLLTVACSGPDPHAHDE